MCCLSLYIVENTLKFLCVYGESVCLPELLLSIDADDVVTFEHKVYIAVVEQLLET